MLLNYIIHPLIIDFIANIYSRDKIQLYFNGIHVLLCYSLLYYVYVLCSRNNDQNEYIE